ncbi:hypothetical protein LT875_002486 [Salmonella enterica]|nr:hypothetical protein [Salmonella enterica]
MRHISITKIEWMELMTEPVNSELPAEHLPLVGDVVKVLQMCIDHDIPLDKLPKLWDEHQQLQQVERRAGIQNGNMDREIARLRVLTADQDAQLRAERREIDRLRAHIIELQDALDVAEGHRNA